MRHWCSAKSSASHVGPFSENINLMLINKYRTIHPPKIHNYVILGKMHFGKQFKEKSKGSPFSWLASGFLPHKEWHQGLVLQFSLLHLGLTLSRSWMDSCRCWLAAQNSSNISTVCHRWVKKGLIQGSNRSISLVTSTPPKGSHTSTKPPTTRSWYSTIKKLGRLQGPFFGWVPSVLQN